MSRKPISILILVLFASTCAIGSAGAADCCTKAEKIGEDIWKAFLPAGVAAGCLTSAALSGPLAPGVVVGCLSSAIVWGQIQDKMISFWNSMAGTSSWATIGPRELPLDEWETGTIWSTTGRVFVSLTPAPAGAKIIVNEEGGKGKTAVSIGTVKPEGGCTKVRSKTFNENSSAKSNTNESLDYILKNDRVVIIHLDGKSVGNKFRYKVKIVPDP